jgi:hypothetical protein
MNADSSGYLVAPENREQLGRIIAGYYQTYVSTFSRSIYFDPSANDTIIDASLSALSSRLFVARLNAVVLSVLLFLLGVLISVTLIKQPRPGDTAVGLAEGDSLGHAIAMLFHLPLRPDRRYSLGVRRRLLVHADVE